MDILPPDGTSGEIDFYKAVGETSKIADETSYMSSEFGEESDEEDGDDEAFSNIKKSVISGASGKDLIYGEGSIASRDRTDPSSTSITTHNSLTFGFIPKGCYTHPVKSGALLGICHNPRYRQFLVLDAKGVTSWKYDCSTGPPVVRLLNYPSYQYRVYSNLVYDKKHNVYFCLGKDFSLKILNHQFQETYTVEANLHNVMFLLYNPKREELITGGVGGCKVWQFVQVVEDKGWTEVKAMSNYKLQHKYTLRNVGGGWVKKVTMNHKLSHLYCCSESDLHAYNLDNGDELLSIKGAHVMSITGCVYSTSAQYIVTCSNDTLVKCWSVNGGLIHTFRVHTKAVTQIMTHPDVQSLVLTCSADCSIKLLCLDTLNTLYSITVSSDGVLWMGLTHENLMWACTSRQITMWNLNHFVDFFSLTRSRVNKLSRHSAPKKSTRLLAMGEDSCARLFSSQNRTHLSNVLPMPCLSALEKVRCVAYSRELNLVYCLLNKSKLWIYTTRTDPACRIAQWDVRKIQDMLIKKEEIDQPDGTRKESLLRKASPHKTVGEMHVNVEVCDCTTIATLNSHILLWGDEGWVGTIPTKFLLLGLTDGRVLFMDPFVRGLLHVDFRANKDTIKEIRHDVGNQQLLTQCDRNEVSIIQFWGLPTLQLQHELCLYQNIIASTRMSYTVFYGYSDGSVSFHTLEEVEEDNPNRKTNQIKNVEELRLSGLVQKKVEHKQAILSVDSCPRRRLFLTSSAEAIIKIWSAEDQSVIADVTLDHTLSCAAFLNSSADLVFGFANNLYSIDFATVCPALAADSKDSYAESITAESDIYEDPSITNEGIIPNLEPLDLTTYLKPYELDITKDFLEAADIVVRPQTREKVDDEESEVMSNAPTDVYDSECSTPRLSRMEAFTPEPVKWDQLSAHSGRASRAKSTDSEEDKVLERNKMIEMLDVTNPKHAEYYLPMFGDSPGGSPSVSSAASVADSRSDLDDMSDIETPVHTKTGNKKIRSESKKYEFGSEYVSDEDHTVERPPSEKAVSSKSSKPLPQFPSKRKKAKKSELVLTLAPDDPEAASKTKSGTGAATKYGIDKMQVDVAALMKQGQKKGSKKVTVSAAPPPVKESMADQLANLALKQSLQAGASEISSKKKKAAGARKRAPVGKKQPAAAPTKKQSLTVSEPKPERVKPSALDSQLTKPDKLFLVALAAAKFKKKLTDWRDVPDHHRSAYHLSTSTLRRREISHLAKRVMKSRHSSTPKSSDQLMDTQPTISSSQVSLTRKSSRSVRWNNTAEKYSDITSQPSSDQLLTLEGKNYPSSILTHTPDGVEQHPRYDISRHSLEISAEYSDASTVSSSFLLAPHSSDVERVMSADKLKRHSEWGKSIRLAKIDKLEKDALNIRVERTWAKMTSGYAIARATVSDVNIGQMKPATMSRSEALVHTPINRLLASDVTESSEFYLPTRKVESSENYLDSACLQSDSQRETCNDFVHSSSNISQLLAASLGRSKSKEISDAAELMPKKSASLTQLYSPSMRQFQDWNLMFNLLAIKRKSQPQKFTPKSASQQETSQKVDATSKWLKTRVKKFYVSEQRETPVHMDTADIMEQLDSTSSERRSEVSVSSLAEFSSTIFAQVKTSDKLSDMSISPVDLLRDSSERCSSLYLDPSHQTSVQLEDILNDGQLHMNMLRELLSSADYGLNEEELVDHVVAAIDKQVKQCVIHSSLAQSVNDSLSTGKDGDFLRLWQPYFHFIVSDQFHKIWMEKYRQTRYRRPLPKTHFLWSYSPSYHHSTQDRLNEGLVKSEQMPTISEKFSDLRGRSSVYLSSLPENESLATFDGSCNNCLTKVKRLDIPEKISSFSAAQSKSAHTKLLTLANRSVLHRPLNQRSYAGSVENSLVQTQPSPLKSDMAKFHSPNTVLCSLSDEKEHLYLRGSPKVLAEKQEVIKSTRSKTPTRKFGYLEARRERVKFGEKTSVSPKSLLVNEHAQDGQTYELESVDPNISQAEEPTLKFTADETFQDSNLSHHERLEIAQDLENQIVQNHVAVEETLSSTSIAEKALPWQVIIARQKFKRHANLSLFSLNDVESLNDNNSNNLNTDTEDRFTSDENVYLTLQDHSEQLMSLAIHSSSEDVVAKALELFALLIQWCEHAPIQLTALHCLITLWGCIRNTQLEAETFEQLSELAKRVPTESTVYISVIASLLRMLTMCKEHKVRIKYVERLCDISNDLSNCTRLHSEAPLSPNTLLKMITETISYCKRAVYLDNSIRTSQYNSTWSTAFSRISQKIDSSLKENMIHYTEQTRKPANHSQLLQLWKQTPPEGSVKVLSNMLQHMSDFTLSSLPEPLQQFISIHKLSAPVVSTVSGDLISGLIPALVAAPIQKKAAPKRKGQLIQAKISPAYPDEMVKVALDNDNNHDVTQQRFNPMSLKLAALRRLQQLVLLYELFVYISAINRGRVDNPSVNLASSTEPHIAGHMRERLEEIDDDVDLANYMDIDDDMECKSAASWNPKFDFERPYSHRKASAGRKTSSISTQGLRPSSSHIDAAREGFSQLGSPDSRLRVSVTGRTPGLSERMSDIDALSIQMDAYDDIVEDCLTPQPSVSESAADESTTRSGMSPIRLPNLLPDFDTPGIPAQSDALSRWLMGSMPRAGSAVESESHTRPGTTYSELRPQSRDVKSQLSTVNSKSILKVSPFLKSRMESQNRKGQKSIHVTIEDGSQDSTSELDVNEVRPTSAVTDLSQSKMLGFRSRRPYTAPSVPYPSYEDLQEAFDEALLRFQGDTNPSPVYHYYQPEGHISTKISTTSYQVINKLFRTTLGVYNDNWQDKVIERHKLLSMQKEIRAKSAVAKRQALHQKLMDKRHSLLGHRHCDGVIDPPSYDPSVATVRVESRPRTNSAVSRPLISVNLSEAKKSAKENKASASSSTSPLMEKANVINESQVQYRFRINESLCEKLHGNFKPSTPLPQEREPDSVSYDPRRPDSVRRPGTRSIPSRCTRFVLVKQKRNNNRPSSPTPLEKQLLSKRFPTAANKIIPDYNRNRTIVNPHHQKMKESQKISVPS